MPEIPKNAKKPSDHVSKGEAAAAKAEALGEPIKVDWTYAAPTENDPEATASTVFEIDREVANDYEVIELYGDIDDAVEDGDDGAAALVATRLMRKLLGRPELKRLKATVTNDAGRVDPERMMEFFHAANEAMGNSTASPGS